MQSYLKRILTARVYDVPIESPLEAAPNHAARTGNIILLKREDMQPVFSFKLRGAYNKMAQLTPAQLKRGVITASAGNHGQGTIGMEILRQHNQPIHAIFCAIGGGGLISGVAAYVKQVRPEIKVIGVQPVDSDAMYQSLKHNKRVVLDHVGLFADGVAVKQVGQETFRLCRELVDEVILVDTDAACAAIKDV